MRHRKCGSNEPHLLVLRRRISRTSLVELLRVLARSLGLERSAERLSILNLRGLCLHKWRKDSDLRDFLLCPLEVAADLFGIAHSLLEALTSSRQASLRLLLQLHKLTLLGVELSRSVAQGWLAKPIKFRNVKPCERR